MGSLARRPLLLPELLKLPAAVAQMRERDDEFAVVLDEHGGLAGIVTYEDIAEELVGDIADESDTVVETAVADGSGWIVDAGRRLDEIEEATGVHLPQESDDYDTLAGLIIDRLGRFPTVGDRLTVDGVGMEVRSLDRHVAEYVRVEHTDRPERTSRAEHTDSPERTGGPGHAGPTEHTDRTGRTGQEPQA